MRNHPKVIYKSPCKYIPLDKLWFVALTFASLDYSSTLVRTNQQQKQKSVEFEWRVKWSANHPVFGKRKEQKNKAESESHHPYPQLHLINLKPCQSSSRNNTDTLGISKRLILIQAEVRVSPSTPRCNCSIRAVTRLPRPRTTSSRRSSWIGPSPRR